MAAIRRALAFPFYLIAFILHLLTALFTIIAQKIGGEDSLPLRNHETLSAAVVCVVALSAIPVWVLTRPPTVDLTRLVPQAPMDYRGAKVDFTSEQMVWVKPLIRLTACIFAERAVKHYLEPASVGFPACGDGGKLQTTLDDNLIDMTVSGTATVDKSERRFKVTLQHYPPSTDEDGFIPTEIWVETGETQVSCESQ